MTEVALPEFEMDCRDWFVVRHDLEESSESPVLAELSTLLLDDGLVEASGSISLGLLDAEDDLADLAARPVRPGAAAHELLEHEPEPGTRRYVVPTPGDADQPRLALLAEFTVPPFAAAELDRRVDALMGSFRWRAA